MELEEEAEENGENAEDDEPNDESNNIPSSESKFVSGSNGKSSVSTSEPGSDNKLGNKGECGSDSSSGKETAHRMTDGDEGAAGPLFSSKSRSRLSSILFDRLDE
jgi:hypothetical protein